MYSFTATGLFAALIDVKHKFLRPFCVFSFSYRHQPGNEARRKLAISHKTQNIQLSNYWNADKFSNYWNVDKFSYWHQVTSN